MGERKVLNKYYPPDFDGAKLPRNKRPRDQLELIRFMLPVTVRCNNCGEYMYAGKKFNVKKETVQNEDYLGLKIFRFYVKCVTCSQQFTIKTDPKNADYICETGASRNFEPWRQQEMAEDEVKKALDEEEMDVMAALENRTLDAKEEMDILDALDELKHLRARQGHLTVEKLLSLQRRRIDALDKPQAAEENKQEEEEERLAREAFAKRNKIVKRLDDDDEPDDREKHQGNALVQASNGEPKQDPVVPPTKAEARGLLGGLNIKITAVKKQVAAAPKPAAALAGLSGYADSEEEDEGSE